MASFWYLTVTCQGLLLCLGRGGAQGFGGTGGRFPGTIWGEGVYPQVWYLVEREGDVMYPTMWAIPWCMWCTPLPSLWTDRPCESITFPQFSLRAVEIVLVCCNRVLLDENFDIPERRMYRWLVHVHHIVLPWKPFWRCGEIGRPRVMSREKHNGRRFLQLI